MLTNQAISPNLLRPDSTVFFQGDLQYHEAKATGDKLSPVGYG